MTITDIIYCILWTFSTWSLMASDPVPDTSAVPNTVECCRSKRISEFCVQKLCNASEPPDEFTIFAVASRCPSYLSLVSQCLADGRNHMACCKKNAKNIREECLHLCDGTATTLNISDWENYKRYLACLTFNIKPIYGCMSRGYLLSPGPPSRVEVAQTGASFASISWKPPRKLQKFTRRYRISYWEVTNQTHGPHGKIFSVLTRDSIHRLIDLNPGTKYGASVEALGNEEYKSLPSAPVHFITKGVAPVVERHHDSEQAGLGSVATFVCNVKIYGTQHTGGFKLFWQKQYKGGGWADILKAESSQAVRRTADGKFEMVSYRVKANAWSHPIANADGQLHYITALRIRTINASGYGNYRCLARNDFGDSSALLRLKRTKRISPPLSPNNITACCEKEGVHPQCLDSCRSNAALQDGEGSTGVPSLQCAMNVPIVLKCSTAGMNYDACCLAKRVPIECLPLCDGSIKSPTHGPLFGCLLHTTNILACHLEAKTPLPHPPTDIIITGKGTRGFKLQWRPESMAKTYYIYYRQKDAGDRGSETQWRRKSSRTSQLVITGLLRTAVYEIMIIAANESGFSDSSKAVTLALKDGILQEINGIGGGQKLFLRAKRPSQFLEE